ncbi:MAG: hypothetical protein QNJ37_20215 [Crocosphaera sp.]|nr:hypothetical protein [Crocosphaera sp.]
MMLLSSKTSLTVPTHSNRQIEGAFNDSYQERWFAEIITINGIEIPLKFSDSREKFLPSAETISAWYLAHYGISNPLDLDPGLIGEALENLATWWVNVCDRPIFADKLS